MTGEPPVEDRRKEQSRAPADFGTTRPASSPSGSTRSRSSGDAAPPANWGLALDLGMRLGVSVVIGLGIGLLVDSFLHTTPVFTLIGIVLGVAAAMYTIWEVAREAMRR